MPYLNDRYGNHYLLTVINQPADVSIDRWGKMNPVIPSLRKGTGSSTIFECPTRRIYNSYSGDYADLGNLKTVYEIAWKLPNFDNSASIHINNGYSSVENPSYVGERGKGYDHEYSASRPLTLNYDNLKTAKAPIYEYKLEGFGIPDNCIKINKSDTNGWGSYGQGGNFYYRPVSIYLDLLKMADALSYFSGKNCYVVMQIACLTSRNVGEVEEGLRLLETDYRNKTDGTKEYRSLVLFDSGTSPSRSDDQGAPIWHRDTDAIERYYGASNLLYTGFKIDDVYNMKHNDIEHGGGYTNFEKELIPIIFADARLAWPRRMCLKFILCVD